MPSPTTPRSREPDGPGRGAGQLLHHAAHLHAAVGPVAGPVRERVGREAGVGDEAHVGTAVAEPEDGVGMGEHLAAGVEVPVGVVREGGVEEAAPVVLRQQVEHQLGGIGTERGAPAAARSSRARARSRARRRAGRGGRSRSGADDPCRRPRPRRARPAGGRGRRGRAARAPARPPAVRRSPCRPGRPGTGGTRTAGPTSRPTGRGATWARIGRPSATAASIRPSRSLHWSGRRWLWASESDSGTPVRATMERIMSNSPSRSGQKSEISSTTPCPASATPSAMASSSSALARREGVGSPVAVRWFSVRDVEKPIAPRPHGVGRQRCASRQRPPPSPPRGGRPARP